MKMKSNHIFIPALTPQEAVGLSGYSTHSELLTLLEIKNTYEAKVQANEDVYNTLLLLSACWTAGKIEGIRAERLKHKLKQ